MKEKSTYLKVGDDEILMHKFEYNSDGSINKEYEYDEEGQLYATTTYHYRSDLQLERKESHNLDEFTIEVLFQYNSADKLISETNFQNGEKWEETLYKYDAQSRLIEVREFDAEGNLSKLEQLNPVERTKKIIEYDDEGNAIVEIKMELSETGKVLLENEVTHVGLYSGVSKEINTYDENDNRIKTEIFEEGELVLEESYFFNKAGVEIRSLGMDEERKTEILRKVDEYNNVILEEQFVNDVLENSFAKTYNDKNDLTYEKKWSIRPAQIGLIDEYVYKYVY